MPQKWFQLNLGSPQLSWVVATWTQILIGGWKGGHVLHGVQTHCLLERHHYLGEAQPVGRKGSETTPEVSFPFAVSSDWPWAHQVALVVKKPPANAGDVRNVGLIPGLGRSSGGGNDTSLQYSCQENPMDRGAWQSTVYAVCKESDMTEHLRTWLTAGIQHHGDSQPKISRTMFSPAFSLDYTKELPLEESSLSILPSLLSEHTWNLDIQRSHCESILWFLKKESEKWVP